jgi:polar amino acid transport system permease protein
MSYTWDFRIIWEYRFVLLDGLYLSVLLSGAAIAVGTLLAPLFTLGMLNANPVVRLVATFIVQIIRGVPLLVSLVFAYYVLPVVLGARLSPFTTAWIVMSMYLAAFVSDVLRGGVRAVPREYIEAGMAIGMTRFAVCCRIVLPEIVRRSLPGVTALYISLFKYSTLASTISVSELMHVSDIIIVERYKPLEIYTAVAGLYLVIVLPLSYAARRIERHPWFGHLPGRQS